MLPLITHTEALAGRRVIAMADADNISISLQRVHGLTLDASALRLRLGHRTRKLIAAAVLTTRPGLKFTTREWQRAGWDVTAVLRETAITCRGPEYLANGDIDLAFQTGVLVTKNPVVDVLLLLSGDGNLASALAHDVRRMRRGMSVVAAAVPGAASARLRDRSTFDAYFDLGADITREAALRCA